MKVQFDKLQYSTVGRSSCLVHVWWMKDQSRTVNLCLFKCMYSSCKYNYVFRVCVCVWGGGGGGGMGGGGLRQNSSVICKNHELY